MFFILACLALLSSSSHSPHSIIKTIIIFVVPKKAPQNIEAQPFNATALTVNWDPVPNERSITGGELLGFHVSITGMLGLI